MAGADLFYKAKQSGYQSQFIPLPLQALQGALQGRQQTYDKTKALLDTYEDFEIKSLPGDDRTYADSKEKEVRDFIDQSIDKDLGDPQYAKEFSNLLKSLKRDERLKLIDQSYNIDQRRLEHQRELQKSGVYDYNKMLEEEHYNQAYNKLIQPGSGGSQSNQLASPEFPRGLNTREEIEKVYNGIKPNVTFHTEVIKGKEYTRTEEYIDPIRIVEATNSGFEGMNAPDNPVGRQIKAEFNVLNRSLKENGLEGIVWEEGDEALANAMGAEVGDPMTAQQYLYKRMFNTGMEKHHLKNKAKGLADALKEINKIKEEDVQDPVFQLHGQIPYKKGPEFTIDEASQMFSKFEEQKNALTTVMEGVLEGKNTYQQAYRQAEQANPNAAPGDLHNIITSDPAYGLDDNQRMMFLQDDPVEMMKDNYLPIKYKEADFILKDVADDVLEAENRLDGAVANAYPEGSAEYYKHQKLYEDNQNVAGFNDSLNSYRMLNQYDLTNLEIFSSQYGKGGTGRSNKPGSSPLWFYQDRQGNYRLVQEGDVKSVTETTEMDPKNIWEAMFGGKQIQTPAGVEYMLYGDTPVFSLDQLAWQLQASGQDPISTLSNLKLGGNHRGKSINDYTNMTLAGDGPNAARAEDAVMDWEYTMADMDLYLGEQEKIASFMEGNSNAISGKTKEEYNKDVTVFPKTTAYNQDKKVYTKRTFDGKTITESPKTPTASAYINRFLENPGYWTIYDEKGNILSAEDKSKLNLTDAKLTAEHTDKHWDEAAFDGVATETYRTVDPNNKDRTIEQKRTRQLTFVLTGLADEDMQDYNEARKNEFYSNYLANPYSNDGKQDYINYVTFDNPELANRLSDMETNNAELDYESFGVKFTARKTVNGGYELNATYTDQDGNTEEMATDHIQTLGQLASKIRTISLYQEAKENFDNKVIDENQWKQFLSGWGTGILK